MVSVEAFFVVILVSVVVICALLWVIRCRCQEIDDLCEALMALMMSGSALVASSEALTKARARSPYCSCDVCQLLDENEPASDEVG